jgi:hypothetical protein
MAAFSDTKFDYHDIAFRGNREVPSGAGDSQGQILYDDIQSRGYLDSAD